MTRASQEFPIRHQLDLAIVSIKLAHEAFIQRGKEGDDMAALKLEFHALRILVPMLEEENLKELDLFP